MTDTPFVKEWKAEAVAKAVVLVLESRFSPLPEELASRIRASKDPDQVERWVVKAGTAATLDQFRQETGL